MIMVALSHSRIVPQDQERGRSEGESSLPSFIALEKRHDTHEQGELQDEQLDFQQSPQQNAALDRAVRAAESGEQGKHRRRSRRDGRCHQVIMGFMDRGYSGRQTLGSST